MPTYEYACSACGHAWEQTQRITEEPVETCPQCGKASAHRLISAGTNFILKGSGWYSDLYSSPKPAAADKADKPADKSETKAEKSDTTATPAAKTSDSAAAKPAAGTTSTPSGTGASSGTPSSTPST